MAGSLMDAANKSAANGQNKGQPQAWNKFVGMEQPMMQQQAQQQAQGMQQNGPGMDQQFGSLIQMLMGGAQPRGRR